MEIVQVNPNTQFGNQQLSPVGAAKHSADLKSEEIAASFTMDLEGGNAELEFARNLLRLRSHVAVLMDDRRLVPFAEELASFTMEGGGNAEHEFQQVIGRLLDRVDNPPQNPQDPFSQVIHKVYDRLRGVSRGSYDPKVVSVGPMNRDKVNAEASQRVKTHYVNILLSRFGDQREGIRAMCEQKVRDSLNKIKAFYPDVNFIDDENFSNDAVTVRWLCEDAFFILGFCVWFKDPPPPNMPPVETIMHDLVLLENQIPLFVLDEILKTIAQDASLVKHLLPILSHNNLFKTVINIDNVSTTDTPHILGLLHGCYKPPDDSIRPNPPSSRIRSSVALHKSGVNFEPNQTTNWMMGMSTNLPSFGSWFKLTLRMPVLRVDVHTETVLWNLIEYECKYASLKYITSYAWGMQMLMKTEEDVALLVDSGVLQFNCTRSNEHVAKMFNKIFKNFTSGDSFYEVQWTAIDKYYSSSWTASFKKACSSIKWTLFIAILGLAVAVASFALFIIKNF